MAAPMKLHFEAELDFQLEAIAAVVDLFEGRTEESSQFTVLPPGAAAQLQLDGRLQGTGVGNAWGLSPEQVLANLRRVQLRVGLAPSEGPLDLDDLDITVEMETGTGKTYVYLRTVYELHQRYGLTKFIVVVPSVAIREGVKKSLDIMAEHLGGLYGNPPVRSFVYDSSDLPRVQSFATSPQLEIMVATIQALRQTDQVLFHRPTEKLQGARPAELIQGTRPVVIVDEPQSVDGGAAGAGRQALRALHPLLTLRYSATHIDRHHMVYRLDAVDAFERKLVKAIQVSSATVHGGGDRAYVRLVEVVRKGKSRLFARLEVDTEDGKGGVRRTVVRAMDGDELEEHTGRALYRDLRVGEVRYGRRAEDREVQLFTPDGEEHWLAEGAALGDVPLAELQRQMIRRTIAEHLKRAARLHPKGIKVLSLFFVDEVAHYRSYDAEGNAVPGPFARAFEAEYRALCRDRKVRAAFGEHGPPDPSTVHDGYFSIDRSRRKGTSKWVDTQERNAKGRAAAEEAYKLIMQDKERLLSLDTPLQFIFSHSALREGWDNPNVFQLCSLRDMRTERQRRQSIGRGLRLCVNQQGRRVRDPGINRLTVVALESVADFAAGLQREIAEQAGITFGVVDKGAFAALVLPAGEGEGGRSEPEPLGTERSAALWRWLKEQGYIDALGRVTEALAAALAAEALDLPEAFAGLEAEVLRILRKLARGVEVRDADEAEPVELNREVLDHPDFQALWGRIKHKTVYRVHFDVETLAARCVAAMQDEDFEPERLRLTWTTARLDVDQAGVHVEKARQVGGPRSLRGERPPVPDVLTALQDRTGLTRRTLARILVDSGQLGLLARRPQAFLQATVAVIRRELRRALVDGVRYERLGDSEAYALSLFEERELVAYLGRNAVPSTKSPHRYTVYDSEGIEKPFAEWLEGAEAVRFYVKLPGWFRIPTPLGAYNPDWAVLVEAPGAAEGQEKLYFVVETKGHLELERLRLTEADKIRCGKRHFAALAEEVLPPEGGSMLREDVPAYGAAPGARYVVARDGQDFVQRWPEEAT